MSLSAPTQDDLVKAGLWAQVATMFKNMTKKVITVDLNASSVSKWLFIADRAYTVAITENHSVVGGAAALVKIRKVTADGVAPGAAAAANVIEFVTAGIDLTATVNTVQTPAMAVTTLAAGDRLATLMSGTLTGLVGSVTIVLTPA